MDSVLDYEHCDLRGLCRFVKLLMELDFCLHSRGRYADQTCAICVCVFSRTHCIQKQAHPWKEHVCQHATVFTIIIISTSSSCRGSRMLASLSGSERSRRVETQTTPSSTPLSFCIVKHSSSPYTPCQFDFIAFSHIMKLSLHTFNSPTETSWAKASEMRNKGSPTARNVTILSTANSRRMPLYLVSVGSFNKKSEKTYSVATCAIAMSDGNKKSVPSNWWESPFLFN